MNRFKNIYDAEAWQSRLEADIYEAKSTLWELLDNHKISPLICLKLGSECDKALNKVRDIGNNLYLLFYDEYTKAD